MTQSAQDDPSAPLSALQLAGRSIAERQLDFALALGCERVICIASGLDRQLLALQHRVEAAGGRFNLLSGTRSLVGLVNASDELVVIAEGLLPAMEDAQKALGTGNGVLVLPVETGLAAGFERIDLNHAWAGVLAMPGRLVERLAELPADCDIVSSLLRIALQGRVPERSLPDSVLAHGRWSLIGSRRQLGEIEPEWFRRHAAAPNWFAPGRALARLAVRLFGGRLLESVIRPALLAAAGVLLAGGGVAAGWFGNIVPALALAAVGWLVAETGFGLATLAQAGIRGGGRSQNLAPPIGALTDLAMVGILALALQGGWPARFFAPLVLFGLLRIGKRMISAAWAEILDDRAVLALILSVAAGFGLLLPAIELLVLALLALLLARPLGPAKLTRA